tara:strand:- start:690 stop:1448 length:759 start_codon:yes stop_codon:yes gene_type:complete
MEKFNKSIDIILPNYNSSEYLEETINSVIHQIYKNWKLIIVDDASNIKTKKVLRKYSKFRNIKTYWLKKNHGAGYCRNYAIKRSKSEYLAFIDSDDVWKKNKLIDQIKYIRKNNYSFGYTNYETFGSKYRKVKNPSSLNYNDFIHNTSIATSTMIVERKTIKNIKFSNTKICEDYYFKCKLLKKIGRAYCLNKYLVKYRIRKDSLQSSNLRNLYWIWKINKRYNKLNFFNNFISLLSISFNSLKKYGGKNIF